MIERRFRRVGGTEHRARLNEGRDQDGRHADPEQVELKKVLPVQAVGVFRAPEWRDVIVGAAMLVERDDQQRFIPLRTISDGVVDIQDKLLAGLDDGIWMVIVAGNAQAGPSRFEIGERGQATAPAWRKNNEMSPISHSPAAWEIYGNVYSV